MQSDVAIINVSDWHVGSILSYWPESVLLPNGSRWSSNVVQAWLKEKEDVFWSFARSLTKKRKAIVVVNGDMCEGVHHYMSELITLNREFQRRAVVEKIAMLRQNNDSWYIVRGTSAHDGFEGEDAETIAREIGCQQKADGTYSYYILDLLINSVNINFAHHIGTTQSPVSETTALVTQLIKAARDNGMWNIRMPDIMSRAHRHRAAYVLLPGTGQGRAVFTTPAWKANGEHGVRIDPTAIPQIGGAVILIDKNGEWEVRQKHWSLPVREAVKVE